MLLVIIISYKLDKKRYMKLSKTIFFLIVISTLMIMVNSCKKEEPDKYKKFKKISDDVLIFLENAGIF